MFVIGSEVGGCVWLYEVSSVLWVVSVLLVVTGEGGAFSLSHTHTHTVMFISQVALRGNGCAELWPVCRLYCTQIGQQAGR